MRRIIKYHRGSVWIVKLPTVENGTHVTGFRSAVTKAIVKYYQ